MVIMNITILTVQLCSLRQSKTADWKENAFGLEKMGHHSRPHRLSWICFRVGIRGWVWLVVHPIVGEEPSLPKLQRRYH